MPTDLMRRVLVPVASLEDTEATCQAILPHLSEDTETVVLLHVINQTEGYIDPASPKHLEEEAEKMFRVAQDSVGPDLPLQTSLRFGTNVVDEIKESAAEHDATAIAFRPRPGGVLTKLVPEDTQARLITEAPCPVIAFPDSAAPDEGT